MKLIRHIFKITFFFIVFNLYSQESPYIVKTRIDWFNLKLVADIGLDLAKANLRMPAAGLEAQRMIARDLANLIKDDILGLLVDSSRNISSTMLDDTLNIEDLLESIKKCKRTDAHFSYDLNMYQTTWEFSLIDFSALYVRHTVPYEPPPSLYYVPTKSYSGIIIYAAGPFPVKGEFVNSRLFPCLFPRIFDSKMNLVLERNMMIPENLKKWGMVAYAADISSSALETRVGNDPLRIMAFNIFGSNRTDIVITEEDALKILNLPENRELLKNGRIVVIIDSQIE